MRIKKLLSFFVIAAIFAACGDSKDEPKPNPVEKEEDIVMATVVTNPEGNNGSVYLQAIPNMKPATYDNKNSAQIGFGSMPIALDNGHIYALPDYMGKGKAELKLFTREKGNKIVLKGSLPIPPGAAACNVVELNEEKAYLACQSISQVIVFNPATMKEIKKIDVSKFSRKGVKASPASMIIRDNYLFVPLFQIDSKWMPATNTVDILVYDVAKDEYVKTITDEKLGVCCPTRPVDSKSIFLDEKGDIYLICLGSFGFIPGFNAGIIRIKKGETRIDPDYCIRLDQTEIENLSTKKAEFLASVYYDKNGKLYAYANSFALAPESKNPYLALCNAAVCVDIYDKTIKKIDGLPICNPQGIAIGKYKDKIVFGSSNKENNAFYMYSPKEDKVEGPVVHVQGFPSFFHYFSK